MSRRALRIATLLLLIPALNVRAEKLLMVTQGANAQKLPAGAYAHLVDTDAGTVSAAQQISETRWTGDWTASTDKTRLVGTSLVRGDIRIGERAPVGLKLNPLRVETLKSAEPGPLIAAVPVAIDTPAANTTALVYAAGDRGTFAYEAGGRFLALPLSMTPVAAVPGVGGESVVVVVRDPASDEFGLQWCDTTGARTIHRLKPAGAIEEQFEVTLDHAILSPDGMRLLLAYSGYVLDEAAGDRRARLEIWDLEKRELWAARDLSEGIWPTGTKPLLTNTRGDVWALTHTPGRGFVYLTKLTAAEEGFDAPVERSFSGVHDTPIFALRLHGPNAGHIALTLDESVLLHDGNLKRYHTVELENSATALTWTAEGLYAGVGSRLLRLDEDAPLSIIARANSGRIVELFPAPSARANADDTPMRITKLPRQIEFDENQIGLQFYTLPANLQDITSRPSWIALARADDSHVKVSVDPRSIPRDGPAFGEIVIGTDNTDAHRIITRIRAASQTEPRLLWVRNPAVNPVSVFSEASPFSTLIHNLSRYPALIRHDELAAPGNVDLDNYTGVVLTSATAPHGILTRQEILDFLTGGGTVVYLASLQPGETDLQSTRWLEAVGISLDAANPLSGSFEAPAHTGLLRHWAAPTLRNGAALMASDPRTRLVPGSVDSESAVLAIGAYGRGRVIALASSTPLENPALKDPRALNFAKSLFRQQGESGSFVNDADRDGIPDHVEDRNGNGVMDAGETNSQDTDTDGDGIPDGLEDINQNGFVDELETHPLLADTDEDGIPDPADAQPLPPTGTPYIASVEPPDMPAEGSRPILITGRNFSSDSQIWFGDIPTPEFRVLSSSQVEAIVPPFSGTDPEPVTIRMESDAGANAQIENGFTYTEASAAVLSLRSLRAAREVYGVYALHTQAVINPTDVAVNLVKVMLEVDPPEAAEDLEVHRGQNIASPLIARPAGPGRVLVVVNDVPQSSRPLALFRVQMRANTLTAKSPEVTLRLIEKVVRSDYGGVLDSSGRTDLYFNFASSFHPFTE